MESIVANALNQALAQLAGQAFQAIAQNPQDAIDFANSLFAHPHHTGYDAIQLVHMGRSSLPLSESNS